MRNDRSLLQLAAIVLGLAAVVFLFLDLIQPSLRILVAGLFVVAAIVLLRESNKDR